MVRRVFTVRCSQRSLHLEHRNGSHLGAEGGVHLLALFARDLGVYLGRGRIWV